MHMDAFAGITAGVIIPKALDKLMGLVQRKNDSFSLFIKEYITGNKTTAINVLFVTWKVVISNINKGYSLDYLANKVGDAALVEIRVLKLNPMDYKKIIARALYTRQREIAYKMMKDIMKSHSTEFLSYDVFFRKKLGSFLLNAFNDALYLKTVYKHGKPKKVVKLKPDLVELLFKYRDNLAVPTYVPTIIPPRKPWKDTHGVYQIGYYYLERPLILGYHVKSKIIPAGAHMKAIEIAQSVPFTTNKEMIDVLETMVTKRYDGIAGLPEFNLELPPKPWQDEDEYQWYKENKPDEVALWKKQAREIHKKQLRNEGKIIALAFLRNILSTYKDFPKFYFPVAADFRGRLYYSSVYLTYHGDDVSKGLLEFDYKEPLNEDGFRWLKIALANVAGNDKVTYEERIAWTEANHEDILRSAKEPLDYLWWADMDEPFQFLKLAKSYAKYIENPNTPLGTIVAVDGANNGTQHLAAMSKNREMGRYVNLLSEDKVYDIYQEAADRLYKVIKNDNPTDDKDKQVRDFWLYGDNGKTLITRKLIKRPVMTKAYSVTPGGMIDQVLDYLIHNDKPRPPGMQDYKYIGYLTKKLDAILKQMMPIDVMEWLKEVVRIAGKDNDFSWRLPTGFLVIQSYKKAVFRRLSTPWGPAKIRIAAHYLTDKQDTRKMTLGIAPNFVHSWDAVHLVNILNVFHKQYPKIPIAIQHDSFGTHPNYVSALQKIIRETFVKQYEGDFLMRQKKAWEKYYGVKLPDPPITNTLDITEILNAPYFFS